MPNRPPDLFSPKRNCYLQGSKRSVVLKAILLWFAVSGWLLGLSTSMGVAAPLTKHLVEPVSQINPTPSPPVCFQSLPADESDAVRWSESLTPARQPAAGLNPWKFPPASAAVRHWPAFGPHSTPVSGGPTLFLLQILLRR